MGMPAACLCPHCGQTIYQSSFSLLRDRRFHLANELGQAICPGIKRRRLVASLASRFQRGIRKPDIYLLLSFGLLRHGSTILGNEVCGVVNEAGSLSRLFLVRSRDVRLREIVDQSKARAVGFACLSRHSFPCPRYQLLDSLCGTLGVDMVSTHLVLSPSSFCLRCENHFSSDGSLSLLFWIGSYPSCLGLHVYSGYGGLSLVLFESGKNT